MTVQILHGPKLETVPASKRDRKAPAGWNYQARLYPEMATAVDRIARAANVTPSDIIRSALVMFLKHTAKEYGSPLPHVDQPAAPAIAQPHTAAPYRGTGGADMPALRGVATRQAQRHAGGQAGERLKDKAAPR